jgi:hypothetical protein
MESQAGENEEEVPDTSPWPEHHRGEIKHLLNTLPLPTELQGRGSQDPHPFCRGGGSGQGDRTVFSTATQLTSVQWDGAFSLCHLEPNRRGEQNIWL